MRLKCQNRVAAKALLIGEEAIEIFFGIQHLSDSAKIIERAAVRLGPVDRRPLKRWLGMRLRSALDDAPNI